MHVISSGRSPAAADTEEPQKSPPPPRSASFNVLINGWPRTTHEDLRRVAEQFGPVESVNVVASESRAFVSFATSEGAQRCITDLPLMPIRLRLAGAPPSEPPVVAKLSAFASDRGGSSPSNTFYIRNIPSAVPYTAVLNLLTHVVGDISVVRRFDCQNRHAVAGGAAAMSFHFIEVSFFDVPTQRSRETICDLTSLPAIDGSEVQLPIPLVVKYHEPASSRSPLTVAPKSPAGLFTPSSVPTTPHSFVMVSPASIFNTSNREMMLPNTPVGQQATVMTPVFSDVTTHMIPDLAAAGPVTLSPLPPRHAAFVSASSSHHHQPSVAGSGYGMSGQQATPTFTVRPPAAATALMGYVPHHPPHPGDAVLYSLPVAAGGATTHQQYLLPSQQQGSSSTADYGNSMQYLSHSPSQLLTTHPLQQPMPTPGYYAPQQHHHYHHHQQQQQQQHHFFY